MQNTIFYEQIGLKNVLIISHIKIKVKILHATIHHVEKKDLNKK